MNKNEKRFVVTELIFGDMGPMKPEAIGIYGSELEAANAIAKQTIVAIEDAKGMKVKAIVDPNVNAVWFGEGGEWNEGVLWNVTELH